MPRTTSQWLRAPPSCSLTASHVRGRSPCQLLLLLPSVKPSRVTRSATTAPKAASPLSFPDSGDSVQVRGRESVQKEAIYLSPQEHTRFKHGREVPPAAHLQYLKPQLLAQALVHHKFVFTLPRGSGTTPKISRSWSRKRTASRVFGTLNAT